MFPLKVDKKIHFGGSLSATKCYHIKLSPGTYQLFLLPGMKRACTHIRLCIQPKSGKNINRFFRFFLFRESIFFSLNRDKYFALYWRFCVRISVILLLIKWSEMDPNVKPQTLVETFIPKKLLY